MKPIFVSSFAIRRVGVASEPELLLAQCAALGPSLAVGESPSWIAFGFGKFSAKEHSAGIANGGGSRTDFRFAVAHADETRARNVLGPTLCDLLRSQTEQIIFEELKSDDWLKRIFCGSLSILYVSGMVPRFVAHGTQANALWMSRMLSALEQFDSPDGGVVVVLRPAEAGPLQDSPIAELRSHFERSTVERRRVGGVRSKSTVVISSSRTEKTGTVSKGKNEDTSRTRTIDSLIDRSEEISIDEDVQSSGKREQRRNVQKEKGKQSQDQISNFANNSNATMESSSEERQGEDSNTEQVDESREAVGEADVRARGISLLDECLRSGAWWVSVLCFGTNESVTRKVVAMFWAAVSSVRNVSIATVDAPRPFLVERSDSQRSLTDGPKLFDADCSRRRPSKNTLDLALARSGVDVSYCQPVEAKRLDGQAGNVLASVVDRFVEPFDNEMLLSGERLSALVQLPVEPTTALEVVQGFGYCRVPFLTDDCKSRALRVGYYCVGGLPPEGHPPPHPARISLDDLTKHMLIVGATGSGKTTALLSLLRVASSEVPDVKVAILEGAKREYREHAESLGIGIAQVFDLQENYLSINIFEHPATVRPEAHVSTVSAIFESALDMPTPVPILMREGISRAYAAYHAETDTVLRSQLHPIRYWLLRHVLETAKECEYGPENQANIEAALRTRIRALSTGAASRVLAGTDTWAALKERLTEKSLLVELESIADRQSRALVMALFVQYYRYSLGNVPRGGLTNLLVLEEAHRIIGRSPKGDDQREDFSNMLSEVRALGCGIIISDQSPSRLIEDAMRNTNTKLIMRLVSGEDIDAAVVGAGLPHDAATDVPKLRQFQALYLSPSARMPGLVEVDQWFRNVPHRPGSALSSPPSLVSARLTYLRDELLATSTHTYLENLVFRDRKFQRNRDRADPMDVLKDVFVGRELELQAMRTQARGLCTEASGHYISEHAGQRVLCPICRRRIEMEVLASAGRLHGTSVQVASD